MNANTYIKERLKEKNMHVDELVKKAGTSKSTIYRVLNGVQQPSVKLRDKMFQILDLNHEERRELIYYFSLFDVDQNIIESREAIYHFLFGKEDSHLNKIELVYYDDKKYIRTFDDILEDVLEASDKEDFTCHFRLINGIWRDVISPLSNLVTALMERKSRYRFQHLIRFSTDDYKDNIKTLKHIIPLLSLDNYTLDYHEEAHVSRQGFFHDMLILDYSYGKGEEVKEVSLFITFLPENLSTCYVVGENRENTLDFFERNMESLERRYLPALSSRKSLVEYVMTIAELFRSSSSALFRSHIPLARLPRQVYESVIKRTPTEEFVKFFCQDKHQDKSIETHIKEMLGQAKLVEKSTYLNKQLEIYTKEGLAEFASTGLMMDHLEFLPAFNKAEVKMILESVKSRDRNPEDPFNFVIIKENYTNSNLSFGAVDNRCLLVEKYIDSNTPYGIIKHGKLSSAFMDFAYHYVPAMMAIPQEEAYAFIDELIEKYC